ncbi:type II secretion system F family protein [Ornithinimicrobium sp. Y1847]|uniref:type II secretion system F family protein n=1 Tax=Ornithinimicrobium sp. Y1847 TaxID=3405419 RepID=UPI003B67C09B
MVGAIFTGVVLCLVLALLAIRLFLTNARVQTSAGRHVLQLGTQVERSWLQEMESFLGATRPGRWLRRELTTAGLHYPLWAVTLVAVVATVSVPWLLWVYVAPLFAVLGLAAGWFGVRWWITFQRTRYRDKFVDQIPDLARVLSNATNAGLSIRTAWTVAEHEMGQPASEEIGRINTAVRFGASLEDAMLQVEDRLPSREVKVLMSTLVIAARSGGSLVSALRDISYMLDERKETKREVKSVVAQSVATGNAIIVIGLGLMLLVNSIFPGTIERMTQNIVGIVALAFYAGMTFLGWWLIRKITRLDA